MKEPIDLNDIQLQSWMTRLIKRAKKIGALGEVPVCAVILDKEGRCIGHGSNNREQKRDPLGHAEIVALKQASLIKNDWRFNDCTMIVTLEPCPMCAGALLQARMGKLVFGTTDPKRGALGGTIDLSKHSSSHHQMTVIRGILSKETRTQLEDWFKLRRRNSI